MDVLCEAVLFLQGLERGAATVIAAATAAMIAAAAWLAKSVVAWLVWWYERLRKQDELLTALKVEIRTNMDGVEPHASDEQYQRITEQLEAASRAFKTYDIYTLASGDNLVMGTVKSELSIIPNSPLRSIVRYYNLERGLYYLLSDLRSDAFRALSVDRKTAVLGNLREIARSCLKAGANARRMIAVYCWLSRVARAGLLIVAASLIVNLVVKVYAADLAALFGGLQKCLAP